MSEEKNNFQMPKKAWVVTVDMGYGHQRTAYPLRDIAVNGKIINANNYQGIGRRDKRIWHTSRFFYEFISRFRRVPIVGVALFLFMDSFQKILGYYPKRDLSRSNFSGKKIFSLIRKGWGKALIGALKKKRVPLISTFFSPAFMAEYFDYPGKVYCVICDADISRAWVSLRPKQSNITYFAPCSWARDRLLLYGVKAENILFTGYPLPKENIGKNLEIVKKDLGYRLLNLDSQGIYRKLYRPLIKKYLGNLPKLPNHPLTIMFSIGGAGAQTEIALQILNSLKDRIMAKTLRFIIAVGVRKELAAYVAKEITWMALDGWIHVLYGKTMPQYFDAFNKALRTTDILMTKPSELSFYSGLGIPIIIQPPIGSQEDFNKRWLMHIGSAALQENPKYTAEWIEDMLNSGDLAEMAMQGFVEIEKMGTYNIERVVKTGKP